jgi:cytochrome c5
LVTNGSFLKVRRVTQAAIGPILPAALLLGWFASILLSIDTGYGTLAAQTEATQTQAKSRSTEPPLPDGPGKDVVMQACVKCHNLKVITNKRASEEEWATSVNSMVNRGAVLSDDQIDEVIDYLSRNFKPAESDQKKPPDTTTQK